MFDVCSSYPYWFFTWFINYWERSVELSSYNCGFSYFSFHFNLCLLPVLQSSEMHVHLLLLDPLIDLTPLVERRSLFIFNNGILIVKGRLILIYILSDINIATYFWLEFLWYILLIHLLITYFCPYIYKSLIERIEWCLDFHLKWKSLSFN